MQDTNKKIVGILLYLITGMAGSIIVGLISFGSKIFIYSLPAFHFILVGVAGAIIFATVRFFKKWIAATVVLVLALLLLITFKLTQSPQFVFQILMAITTGYTIFAMACLYRTKLGKLLIGKFVLVGLALGILYVALAYGRFISLGMPATYSSLRFFAVFGFLIGCGLGVGIEIGELLYRLLLREKLAPEK